MPAHSAKTAQQIGPLTARGAVFWLHIILMCHQAGLYPFECWRHTRGATGLENL